MLWVSPYSPHPKKEPRNEIAQVFGEIGEVLTSPQRRETSDRISYVPLDFSNILKVN